jgi:pimeloyl-ACP methyl ester carboxylesterase
LEPFVRRPDGERVAYATLGSGPPLIRPPGWISNIETSWESPSGTASRTPTRRLAEKRTVIWYDRHGCGLSDRNRTDFTLDDDLVDLETVVDHLGLRRFSLFGLSSGGATSMLYAAHHSEKVSRLILYGTGACKDPDYHREFGTLHLIGDLIRNDWALASRVLANMFSPSGASADFVAPAEQATRRLRHAGGGRHPLGDYV